MASFGNMSVPGASAAGAALGFGANNNMSIADQIANEDEEAKRKRLQAMANGRPGGLGEGFGNALGLSPAGSALGL